MTEPLRILVVDDEERMRQLLVKLLQRTGYEVEQAPCGREALALTRQRAFDLVLTDIRMPEMDGMQLLRLLQEETPETAVVMMTAFGSVDSAVQAMKEGAYHYISKPFQMDEVLIVVERVVAEGRLRRELASMRSTLQERYGFDNLVGKSKPMRVVYDLVERVAPSTATVLIQGRSGTGKELVARAIHVNGPRHDQPFVPVNCSAIPADLLESELFGHVKGSFTGAVSDRKGLFMDADGGTLFLDEIGDMGTDLQAKLLRVLQDHKIRPVGGTKEVVVDVRVVAATNQNLEQRVAEGAFREDLFFRLNVIPILLPELRQRAEDIPLLVDHFLERYGEQSAGRKMVSQDAMAALVRYAWPGNVRELENAVERASVLCLDDEIGLDDLPDNVRSEQGGRLARLVQDEASLAEVERDYVEMVLERHEGNQTRAAEILGIDRRTLYRKLQTWRDDLSGRGP